MRRRTLALVAMAAALAAVTAYAGVLVVYPVNVQVSEVAPPIHFAEGANAGAAGLGGGTITVTLGANQTSATVSFQVTYQDTYIIDPLRIVNDDTANAYYAKLCVATPLASATGVVTTAEAIVSDGTATLATVDLTTTGCSTEFTIPAGATLYVHFHTTLQEGTQLDTGTLTAQLTLQWSPESPVPSQP